MGNWQEWVAISIAFFSACVVLRDFIQPFMHKKGCGSCGGCGIGNGVVLKIAPNKK